MNILKKVLLIVPVLFVAIIVLVAGYFILDRQDDYDVDLAGVEIPTYKESGQQIRIREVAIVVRLLLRSH